MSVFLSRRVGMYAPYTRSETTFSALFILRYLTQDLKAAEPCRVSYVAPEIPMEGLSEAWTSEVFSARKMSDEAFKAWADNCDVIFWFTPDVERRRMCSDHINHYLFCDIRQWTNQTVRFTKECSVVIVPSGSLGRRMKTLVWSRDLRVVYPDLGFPIRPVMPIADPARMSVVISLFGVKDLRYRYHVLQMIAILLNIRNDIFVTVFLDGAGGCEERKLVDAMGRKQSGSCVFISSMTDFQFFRIINRSDVFVDLNPSPSNCFLLNAAVQRGLVAAAYDVEPNRDILAAGEIGYTIPTDVSVYGFDFEKAVPDIRKVFKMLNSTVFQRQWVLRFKERQLDSRTYNQELEKRRRSFTDMWGAINRPKKKNAPASAFDSESD